MVNRIFALKLNAASNDFQSISTECYEKNWVFKVFHPDTFDRVEALYNGLMDFALIGDSLDTIRIQVEAEEPFFGQAADLSVPKSEANFVAFFNRTVKCLSRFKDALDMDEFAGYVPDNGEWDDFDL